MWPRAPPALQLAWVAHPAPQRGCCQSGMLMAAAALLAVNAKPNDAGIDAAITNLGRRGACPSARTAIKSAAAKMPAKSEATHLVLSGALVVGWGALPSRSPLGAAALLEGRGDGVALNGWLRITPEGAVQLDLPGVVAPAQCVVVFGRTSARLH